MKTRPGDDNRGIAAMWPPVQARSRATQQRILEAAARLLEQRAFGEVSVAEIVRGAGCSVGAFYARFRDKDALLDHLVAIYGDTLESEARALVETPGGESASLAECVSRLIAFYVGFCRRHRGLVRAMLLRARAAGLPSPAPLHAETQLLTGVILGRRAEIAHADPQLAAHLAFAMVTAAVRERVIFGERIAGSVPVTDATLIEELSRACVGYLGG